MGLGDTAGILFKIKADGSQAQGELKEMLASVAGLDGALSGVAGPAGLAAAAIGAITVAAATAVVGLTKLAFSASEYGSAIFDAREKTGLSAETLSTLRVAADSAGSSFDSISGAVSKFSVLVGQANQGNEKAAATLAQYGISARDLEGALQQAVAAIANEKNETLQAAAAKDLFKDRTGKVIPVIKQLGGDLQKATEDAKRLGLTLSNDDVKAADDLGDAFGVLSAQVKAGTSRFALQYAPQITAAIQKIGDFLATNSSSWASWGRDVYNFVTGAKVIVESFGTAVNNIMAGITFGLSNQIGAWNIWAGAVRSAAMVATSGLSEVLVGISKIGAWINGATASVEAQWDPSKIAATVPKISTNVGGGGGGRRGGGGGGISAADDAERKEREAEQRRREAFEREKAELARVLEYSEAVSDTVMARYERDLALGLVNEKQFLAYRIQLINDGMQAKLDALKMERDAAVKNGQDTADVDNDIRIQRERIEAQLLKNEKELEEERQKNHEAELQRIQEELEARQKAQLAKFARQKAEKEYLEKQKLEQTIGSGQEIGALEQLMQSAVGDQNTAAIAGIQALSTAFQGLGQAIGQVVSAWVLYGSAGTSARKVTAQILAGIAQQAAVQAVFQLAEGFAKLAMAYFGVPNAGPSATAHFIAAGIYGSIAGVAAVAGRAVAGNSFSQAAGASTGGNTGVGQGQSQNNNYTTAFGGYGSPLNNLIERQTVVLSQVEETVHQFNTKVTTMPPDHVVALGAAGASRDIRDAYESELSSDPAATENFMRRAGLAR